MKPSVRVSTRMAVALIIGGWLVSSSAVSAQSVPKFLLDGKLAGLSLKTAEPVAEMPLRGAGQQIVIRLDPPATALSIDIDPTSGVTMVSVNAELTGWTVKRGSAVLSEGTDYKTMAVNPTTGARTFVFKTAPYHESTDVPTPTGDALTISATVRLKAGTPETSSDPKVVSLPLTVQKLGIPKLLALFRNTKCEEWKNGDCCEDENEGFVLIMVPSNSRLPIDVGYGKVLPFEIVTSLLSALRDATDNLSQLATGAGDYNFAGSSAALGFFLGELTPYNASRRRLRVGAHDDFGEIEMLDRFWNNVEANDNISSLIFMAQKGNRAYLFNSTDYETDEGWYWVEASDADGIVVRVKSLVGNSPATEPAGRLSIRKSDETFNNKLSSARFSAP